MRNALRWLFTLEGTVGRRPFALVGFSGMALKYAVEALAIHFATGLIWTPLDYLDPSFIARGAKLASAPSGFLLALAFWTLPFIWIGAAMCLRRARDAGFGGGTVLFFFLPYVGYLWMLTLLALPSHERHEESEAAPLPNQASPRVAVIATLVATAFGLVATALSITTFELYGYMLFLGVPFVMGYTAAFLLNRGADQGVKSTLATTTLALVLTGALLMTFAMEGLLCIMMAAIPAMIAAYFGAAFGRATALSRLGPSVLAPALLIVPSMWIESRVHEPVVFEVVTAIEVDASPAELWPNVLAFPDLPSPSSWLFRTGIAYPVRARIEGEGVGAVRHCEFSTGAFVEPVTAWEPPYRLAFDVIASPHSMEEWSFRANVEPPHLDSAFRAIRGEFRLVPLEGGRTRLEGSTWYTLELYPVVYWRFLSDELVHRIHTMVLEHIAATPR